MGLSLQHLLPYAEGEDMLNRIVIADVTWVHHHQPEPKLTSVQRKTSQFTFSFKQMSEVTPSAGKFMLTVFWDFHGVLLPHFQKGGENVNSVSYC
jgi:hypothetical protein